MFNDKLTLMNMGGLLLCIVGTLGYERFKSFNQSYNQGVGREDIEYDPVRQADVELECFLNVDDEDLSDGELSDGWDDMS